MKAYFGASTTKDRVPLEWVPASLDWIYNYITYIYMNIYIYIHIYTYIYIYIYNYIYYIYYIHTYMYKAPKPEKIFGSTPKPQVFAENQENHGFRLKTSGVVFKPVLFSCSRKLFKPCLTRTLRVRAHSSQGWVKTPRVLFERTFSFFAHPRNSADLKLKVYIYIYVIYIYICNILYIYVHIQMTYIYINIIYNIFSDIIQYNMI